MDGGGSALFALVTEKRNRVPGQKLAEDGERSRADLVNKAKERELDAWEQVKVSAPVKTGSRTQGVAGTKGALTWQAAKARKRRRHVRLERVSKPLISGMAMWTSRAALADVHRIPS